MTVTEQIGSGTAALRTRSGSAVAVIIVVASLGALLSTHPIGKLVAIGALFLAALMMRVERTIPILVFAYLALEDFAASPFAGLWTSPVQEAGDFYFATISTSVPWIPIPAAPMFLVPLVLAARVITGRVGAGMSHEKVPIKTPRVFATALVLGGAIVALGVLYGIGTGGDRQQVYYQIFGAVNALCLAAVVGRIGSPALAQTVWKMVTAIAVYRAGLAIFVHFSFAVDLDEPSPYLTTHADSILWTLGIVYVVSNLLEKADRVSKVLAFVLAPLFLYAIQVNNRRLAFVMLAAALGYMFWTLIGVGRERIREGSTYLLPLLGTYLAAGWVSPPSKVFSPVQSLKSVFNGDDRSSQTRDIEDFNLLFTARTTFPLPSGYGKPYIELVVADDISQFFEQYQYLPHNTVLGVLTMVGPVGLALLVAPLVLGAHAAHRVRMVAREPEIRTQTAMIVSAWFSFLAFAWGDLGYFTPQPTAIVGIAAGLGVSLHSWYRVHGHQAAALAKVTR